MAKAFQTLSKGIDLYDVLHFGKYKGCRVIDIIDDYEYFTFLALKTAHTFTPAVKQAVLKSKEVQEAERYDREEVQPYLKPDLLGDFFDDVPF